MFDTTIDTNTNKHTHKHKQTNKQTNKHAHTFTLTLSFSLSLAVIHSLTHSLTHSLIRCRARSLAHSRTQASTVRTHTHKHYLNVCCSQHWAEWMATRSSHTKSKDVSYNAYIRILTTHTHTRAMIKSLYIMAYGHCCLNLLN